MKLTISQLCTKYPGTDYAHWLQPISVSATEDAYVYVTRDDNFELEEAMFIKIPKDKLIELIYRGLNQNLENLYLDVLHPKYAINGVAPTYKECIKMLKKQQEKYMHIKDKEDFYSVIRSSQNYPYNDDGSIAYSWAYLIGDVFTMTSIFVNMEKILVDSNILIKTSNLQNEIEPLFDKYPCLNPNDPRYNEKIVLILEGNKELVDKDGKCPSYGKKFNEFAHNKGKDYLQSAEMRGFIITESQIKRTLSEASSPMVSE